MTGRADDPAREWAASGVLVAGTSSDAGKSLITAGLCRVLARRGISVAPFKAQNMSNNSCVCADGAEIGRAQYLQAQAARVAPSSAMNPVLLKPGSDRRSHIVLRGRPYGSLESGEYATGRRALAAAAFQAYDELAATHDVVVCEGAGSPAEINLRSGDYVNLGLAREKDLPVVVVGDIDRGGVFASLYGTVALLAEADRDHITAFAINKFRGDQTVLDPGLSELTQRTGIPFAGVLPWLDGVWLDAEDSLVVGAWRRGWAETGAEADARGRDPVPAGVQRHRCRSARGRARCGRARHHRPGGGRGGGSGRTAGDPIDGGGSGLAARAPDWPKRSSAGRPAAHRSSASAAASRCSPAVSTTRSSPARDPSPVSACCR